MSDWYHATVDRRRLGPLPAAELRAVDDRCLPTDCRG